METVMLLIATRYCITPMITVLKKYKENPEFFKGAFSVVKKIIVKIKKGDESTTKKKSVFSIFKRKANDTNTAISEEEINKFGWKKLDQNSPISIESSIASIVQSKNGYEAKIIISNNTNDNLIIKEVTATSTDLIINSTICNVKNLRARSQMVITMDVSDIVADPSKLSVAYICERNFEENLVVIEFELKKKV